MTANPGQGSDFRETSNSAAIGNGGQNRMDMWYDETPVGTIVINGGSVNATGVWWGAGIGGGDEMPIASITINGGIVRAESDSSAGIGNGGAGDGGTITITGGTINAVSESACGIGGGYISDIEKVVITGGDITATSDRGAGIGSCAFETTAQVTISGGRVTATSSKGDGIGIGDIFDDPIKFSTGESGTAVIIASSIGDDSGRNEWSGLIFEGGEGKIYGGSYTVEEDLTIPEGETLTIEKDKTLAVNNGAAITNNGAIHLNDGGTYSGDPPKGNAIEYQIQWDTDGDGTMDDTTYVAYDGMPAHEDGSKSADAQYTYTFTGWSPELAKVTEPAKYTAEFSTSINQYTVTLPSGEGYTVTPNGSTTVDYGTEFTFTITVKDGYSKTDEFAVKANGEALTAKDGGSYAVIVEGDTNITVEGVADITAPSDIAVSYGTDSFKEFLNTATFGLFFKDTVKVTISAVDEGSGVKEISYRLGNGELQTAEAQNGSVSFNIQPEFKGNINDVTAEDNAGNTSESIDYEYFAVEQSGPLNVTVDTNGYESGKWTNGDVTITVSGSTATSGIAKYQYSTDGGRNWHDMTATEKTDATAADPLNVTKAQLTVSESGTADYIFRAVSNAENESAASAAVTVKIDKTAPAITLNGDTESYLQEDTAEIIPTVVYSGISKVEVQKGNGNWETINPSADNPDIYYYTVTENGTYTFRVTNMAGTTVTDSITYDKIDSVKPVLVIDSGEYTDDTWTNEDVTLSVSNTAGNLGATTVQYKVDGGVWQNCADDITVSEETEGTRYTFKAVSASGVESDEVSITVKLDKTRPDGDIKIDENSVKTFINAVTFGLFYNENVDVTIYGSDALSGVGSILYYASEDILTEEQVAALTDADWTAYTGTLGVTAVDAEKFIYYVKVTDNAGNSTCFASNGVTFDLTAPAIFGVTDGETYYTTQTVQVTDDNLDTVTLNGETAGSEITLAGNVDTDTEYTIVATDKVRNTTTVTVTMKPTAGLGDAVEGIEPGNVSSSDKEVIEDYLDDLNTRLEDENLTDAEKELIRDLIDDAQALLDNIDEAEQAANTENIQQAQDITPDNVKPDDKEILEAAKEDIKQALENYAGNYTEDEKTQLENTLEQIEEAIEVIQRVEDVEAAIGGLPESVSPDDTKAAEQINTAREQYDALSEREQSLISNEAIDKLNTLLAQLGDYRIIEGDGSTWTKESAEGLTIVANGAYSKYTGIEIDGNAVSSENYTAESGSTVITLKPNYLNTLTAGEHTIIVLYTDGEAQGTFTIAEKPTRPSDNTGSVDEDTGSPQTGEDSHIVPWIMLMLMSGGALFLTLTAKRRNRKGMSKQL